MNHDSRSAAMVHLGRGEFMVAVVDGQRQRRPVYVRYFLYYSYSRAMTDLIFWWLAVEKLGSRQNRLWGFPVNDSSVRHAGTIIYRQLK